MADTVETPSSGEVQESTETEISAGEAEDLDAWAARADKQAAKARRPDGKFAGKPSQDDLEVASALKQTVQGRKPVTQPKPTAKPAEPDEDEVEEEVKPKAKQRRTVKGTVNGEETEFDIDSDEFKKLDAVQTMRASQKAFREAAEMRKESQQLRQALENAKAQVTKDPMALFKALGVSEEAVLEFAQNKALGKVYETIDPNTGQPYTPEQQRIIQLQKELGQRQQTEQEAKQKQEAAEYEQLKDVVRKDVDKQFTTALRETGLPPTPYTMMRLANLMEQMGPDVDPKLVAPMVLEDVVTEIVHTINTVPIETAIELLGEDFMKAVRKYDIAKARAGKDKFGRIAGKYPDNAPTRMPTSKGKMTNPSEAEDYLEKWASQK